VTFEHRPGSGSLFKNDRKTSDRHPDYKGQGVLPDGTECWLSGWIKKTGKGESFLSVSFEKKEDAYMRRNQPPPRSEPPIIGKFADDDIPF
jgi:hypothetical protein